jgi:hypothetical protein
MREQVANKMPTTGLAGVFTVRGGIAVSLLTIATAGCGRWNDADQIEKVSVAGSVFLDGAPLKAGAIVFHPEQRENAASSHGYIENGLYRIDATEGPAHGMVRVEFRPKPLDRDQFESELEQAQKQRRPARANVVEIPQQYGESSEIRIELVSGSINEYDFKLTSRRSNDTSNVAVRKHATQ